MILFVSGTVCRGETFRDFQINFVVGLFGEYFVVEGEGIAFLHLDFWQQLPPRPTALLNNPHLRELIKEIEVDALDLALHVGEVLFGGLLMRGVRGGAAR